MTEPAGVPPALVAQLDRASDYGSEGLGFESLQARNIPPGHSDIGAELPPTPRARENMSENIPPINVEIAGAVSRFWSGGSGPSHSAITSALALAGYEESELEAEQNKHDRVHSAIRAADPATGRRIIVETTAVLATAGLLDDLTRPLASSLATALQRSGHELVAGGYIDWDVSGMRATATFDPGNRSTEPLLPDRADEINEVTIPTVQLLIDCLRRLPSAMRPLVQRQRGRPGLEIVDEYDVQDAVESMLRGLYPDVRPEERCPSYAGSSSTMDFLLKQDSLAIEVKVTKPGRTEKKIKPELLIDFEDYRTHPQVKSVIAVVYDLHSTFNNPVGFENDLTGHRNDIQTYTLVVGWPLPPSQ